MRTLLLSLWMLCCLPAIAQVQTILYVTPPSCDGCCDGAVEMTIDGCLFGAFTIDWTGPGLFSPNAELSVVCEAGVYSVVIIDEIGNAVQVEFEMTFGAAPYTVISNEPLDCLGGGILFDCFFFPPSDSLSNGEVCAVPPNCWAEPIDMVWTDQDGNFISTQDCITDLPPGDYTLLATNDNDESFMITVSLEADAEIGSISQEVCSPDGIAETQAFSIHLAPNPATDFLQLSLDHVGQSLSYFIYDELGRLAQSASLVSSSERIDISNLSGGSYWVQALDSHGNASRVLPFMIVR